MNNEEILQNAFNIIMSFEKRLIKLESGIYENILYKHTDSLQLSVRAQNCLKLLNIKTIGNLIEKSYSELYDIPNLGKTSIKEIEKSLGKLNLKLRKDNEN
jgi:DNA-directed RNA polymerase subunit alpha